MAQEATTMVIKVDFACEKCRKKIKKVLCDIPEIQNQVYDEKANTVTITVKCCSPEKVKKKICCKGGKTAKSIEIAKPEPKPEPKQKPEPKPEPKPQPPQHKQEPKKPKDCPCGVCCRECCQGCRHKQEPKKPKDCPCGVCCRECCQGDPCRTGCRRPGGPSCYGGYVYHSWGAGCYCGYYPCRCTYYICGENPSACTFM